MERLSIKALILITVTFFLFGCETNTEIALDLPSQSNIQNVTRFTVKPIKINTNNNQLSIQILRESTQNKSLIEVDIKDILIALDQNETLLEIQKVTPLNEADYINEELITVVYIPPLESLNITLFTPEEISFNWDFPNP